MSDADEVASTPAPARVGSNADLARRMDRMEQRQDNQETQLRDLAAVVSEIRLGVAHGSELSKLRFDALDTGLNASRTDLAAFMKRIEAIMSGEIQTAQGKAMMDQYTAFVRESIEDRKNIRDRVDVIEEDHIRRDAARQGISGLLSGTKGVVLVIAAIASPIIAVLVNFVLPHATR